MKNPIKKIRFDKKETTIGVPKEIFWTTFILMTIFIGTILVYYNQNNVYKNDFSMKRVFFNETISKQDQLTMTQIIHSIKPQYLNTIRILHIYTDKKMIADHIGFSKNGEIYIVWTYASEFKLVLQHEICHAYSFDEDFCTDIAFADSLVGK
jgi:hypothetical protein